ncbi:DUF6603 domain-containing protein [Mycolicibacterium sp. CR10]|uniref:DUF6603 domain-containing protein n=1 Tax=Mycolicibacterium sp. CR10 TaxID=2562314 RepID=UPI0010BFF904|nr:DUF6603 domain-containing protein [Mycolicibacterium sp. CR10]
MIRFIGITGSPATERLVHRAGLFITGTTAAAGGGWTVLAYADDVARQSLSQDGIRFDTLEDDDVAEARFTAAASQVVDGPSAPEGIRSDISVELLLRVLTHVRDRLNRVALDVLRSAERLSAAVGTPVPPAAFDAVVAAMDRFSSSTVSGFDVRQLDFVDDALTELSAVLAALKAAVGISGLRRVVALVLDSSAIRGDFAGLLGLTGSAPGVQVTDSRVDLTVGTGSKNVLGVLSAGSVAVSGKLTYVGQPKFALTVTLKDLKLAGGADGALLQALGLDNATASLSVSLTSADGLTFDGGARGGRITMVPPKAKGPVRITSLALDVVPTGSRLFVALTSSVQGTLGIPLQLSANSLGIQFEIDPFGEQLVRNAKTTTPSGFGVALDAGPVRGGGFLERKPVAGHPDWTRYSGALSLRLGPVAVTGFAVLTDRPQDFTFAVSMSVQINPPVELGLLFTLNGVGGIIGANVTADTQALAAGVGSGAISRLLFPDDPAGAAAAILDTLAAVFPSHAGGFVVGPMVKLGWGRPVSFVTAELALILSLPDPKVLVLGRVRVAIPAEFAPIIDLKAEIYGEFSGDRVLIIAALTDSRVGFFSVAGQFGLLLRMGDDPTFVLSAGGFHPRYQPPGELATLQRISAEISPPAFHLRVEAYAAITTNTVQFGGAVDIRYGFDGTGIYGTAALDALIQFDPFGFQADLMAGVSVRAFDITLVAVTLRLHLEGPSPWRAWGTGEVQLPWPLPDISIDVGPVTWGSDRPAPAPVISARTLVIDALSRPEAWRATKSDGRHGVVLTEAAAETELLVDPWSLLTATQSAVPLNVDIVRIGASRLAEGERRVVLGEATIFQPSTPGYQVMPSIVPDEFAPGQYLDLSDDDILRRPSFEQMAAGATIDPSVADAVPGVVWVQPHYVTSFPHHRTGGFLEAVDAGGVSGLAVTATAAGSSPIRAPYDTGGEEFPIADAAQMVVLTADTLQGVPGGPATAMTYTLAEQHVLALGAAAAQLVALGGVG